ncbi:MAG: hypothetical protein KAJ76_06240, partial [Candidatus Heimdallarchaeota archaeon]|nr:hypothetical protein [Candidatus Heimdallarchaeota archaeon]
LDTGKAPSVAIKKETKIGAIVPPKTEPIATDMKPSSIPPPPTTTAAPSSTTQSQPIAAGDQNVLQEIERLRSEISEMREIIARLYSDSLGYLQEMKEEVRSMLDYIRTKEG